MTAAAAALILLIISYGAARRWHWTSPWWFEWRGSKDDPTMLIARLLFIPLWYDRKAQKWRSIRVDIHKFIRPDDEGCFHSHPAYAIRVPFWGGYVEELWNPMYYPVRDMMYWWPISVGIVTPGLVHRVHRLMKTVSFSLWIRGPICTDGHLIGPGWRKEDRYA